MLHTKYVVLLSRPEPWLQKSAVSFAQAREPNDLNVFKLQKEPISPVHEASVHCNQPWVDLLSYAFSAHRKLGVCLSLSHEYWLIGCGPST